VKRIGVSALKILGVEGGLVGLIGPLIGLAIVAFALKQRPKPSFGALAP